MSNLSFRCPRLTDRDLALRLSNIAKAFGPGGIQFYFVPFAGADGRYYNIDDLQADETFQQLAAQNSATCASLVLALPVAGPNKWHFLRVIRKPGDFFDDVEAEWNSGRPLPEWQFAKLLALARQELGEIKIGEALSGFPNHTINRYLEARDATLSRLETVNEELLFGIHERQKQMDAEQQKKSEQLEASFKKRHEELQAQYDAKREELEAAEAAFKAREAEFETHESKYLRRQLRQDMLNSLEAFKSKFELTPGTQRLRLPILVFTVMLLIFFGVLMAVGFYQTFDLLKGQDLSKINWSAVLTLSLKQLGITAAFVGVAWFFIKWNDRWFRQHADAEFMFKRLELDVNRASWVVEMAMEWKAEKGTEIPTELLDRLTRNLFKDSDQEEDNGSAPPQLADMLLGAAATAKLVTPSGEITLDRKGIQKALRQNQKERDGHS